MTQASEGDAEVRVVRTQKFQEFVAEVSAARAAGLRVTLDEEPGYYVAEVRPA